MITNSGTQQLNEQNKEKKNVCLALSSSSSKCDLEAIGLAEFINCTAEKTVKWHTIESQSTLFLSLFSRLPLLNHSKRGVRLRRKRESKNALCSNSTTAVALLLQQPLCTITSVTRIGDAQQQTTPNQNRLQLQHLVPPRCRWRKKKKTETVRRSN